MRTPYVRIDTTKVAKPPAAGPQTQEGLANLELVNRDGAVARLVKYGEKIGDDVRGDVFGAFS